MNLFSTHLDQGLELAGRVSRKYAPAFEAADERARAAMAMYFLPHRSSKPVLGVTRPRVLKWYCPFADQRVFPSGHRYCINVYTGCEHQCRYCYASGYEPEQAGCKQDFEKKLLRDLDDLEAFDVPPAPVHLSNSTDAFQPLERQVGQTLFALKQIARHRHRFTTVTVLTKNPGLAVEPAYLNAIKSLATLEPDHPRYESFAATGLPGLRVEVSLAFWRDEMGAFFDPGAAKVSQRKQAIIKLREAGIPVVLRIDPLLPRNPLPNNGTLEMFDLPNAQPLADLEKLIQFAAKQNVMHIVYSAARIIRPRFKPMDEMMKKLKAAYEHLALPQRLLFRGGSYRLPEEIIRQHIVEPFLTLCRKHSQSALFCKQNLLATP